jgi:hypothetical protein
MFIIPSVAIKGGILRYDTFTPLIKPQSALARTPKSIPRGRGSPKLVTLTPRITELNVITVPTERSMPPLTITKVIPTARIPFTAVIIRIFVIFGLDKKNGEAMLKIRKRMIRLENARIVCIALEFIRFCF